MTGEREERVVNKREKQGIMILYGESHVAFSNFLSI
jgi:hypothetical protein